MEYRDLTASVDSLLGRSNRAGDLLPTVVTPASTREKIKSVDAFIMALHGDFVRDENARSGMVGPPSPGQSVPAPPPEGLVVLWSAWKAFLPRWIAFREANLIETWGAWQVLSTKHILETAEQFERDAIDYRARLLASGAQVGTISPRPEPPLELPSLPVLGGGVAIGAIAVLAGMLLLRR